MSDDDILERGGTQEDIDAYAHDVGGACGAVYDGSCDYCGKVTPTEQDNELRRNICGIATGVLWGKNFNELTLNERSRVNAMAKDLEAYITADRKRVALEARIDENKRWLTALAPSMDENVAYNSDFHSRIAELKAKQEEV